METIKYSNLTEEQKEYILSRYIANNYGTLSTAIDIRNYLHLGTADSIRVFNEFIQEINK